MIHFADAQPAFVALLLLALVLVSSELGFRIGNHVPTSSDTASDAVQSVVLTIVGLLLGFMFSFAAQRYEIRRDAGVREANAVSTAYLRASFLREPQASELRRALARHLILRIRFYNASSQSVQSELAAESEPLDDRIWKLATTSPFTRPDGSAILITNAVNDVFDRAAEQNQAFATEIPPAIMLLLFVIIAISGWLTGYGFGRRGHRSQVYALTFAALVTFVTYTIADLSDARGGLIHASDAALVDTRLGGR